jgi:hypothetical protein
MDAKEDHPGKKTHPASMGSPLMYQGVCCGFDLNRTDGWMWMEK